MSWIEEDCHQTAISGLSKAIQRNRLVLNPDYCGSRTVNSFSVDKMTNKQVSLKSRYNYMLQILNKRALGDNALDLSESKLDTLRLELKRMARLIKANFIDEDHPQVDKKWSSIPAIDQQYYQLIFEEKAFHKGFNIYLCKDMWILELENEDSAMSSENEVGSPINEDVLTSFLADTEEFSVESAPVTKRARRRA
ncbi:hypothetical protein INT48_007823 [Thamnidium elegans]|uniref:Uncharacterized protein n=1 Tax=Thamnidium elegans TaxID=101142 RepID=A0A8H7SIL8_9FUNG|nr:hypothetical protein INT48_007823 [Thamnidium elegans]